MVVGGFSGDLHWNYGLTRVFAVLLGQGHHPRDYNPLIDAMKSEDNLAYLRRIRETVRMTASKMPEHGSFLSQHG